MSRIVSGHQRGKPSPGEQEAETYYDMSVASSGEARLLEKGRRPVLQALLTVSAKACFVPCPRQATPREDFMPERRWGRVGVLIHQSESQGLS